MARVINLDELLPEDIVFTYKGRDYTISGDISIAATFDLVELFGRHAEAEEAGDLQAVREVNVELEEKLLELFQERDPDLTELPFGVMAYRHVLAHVLTGLGLQIVGGDGEPAKPKVEKRAVPRSRRTTASRAKGRR
jgi:hypothetical protein